MFPLEIVLFVTLYLLIVNLYLQDERRHVQAQCHPHHWRWVENGWICDLCSLRLKAN